MKLISTLVVVLLTVASAKEYHREGVIHVPLERKPVNSSGRIQDKYYTEEQRQQRRLVDSVYTNNMVNIVNY